MSNLGDPLDISDVSLLFPFEGDEEKSQKQMVIKVGKQCTSSNELIFVVVVVDCTGSLSHLFFLLAICPSRPSLTNIFVVVVFFFFLLLLSSCLRWDGLLSPTKSLWGRST